MTTLPRAPRLLKGGIVLIDPETPAVRAIQNGIASETTAPQRIDCHYLITAWSPIVSGPAVEPAQDEHASFAQVTRVLMQNESLIPREAYASDPLLAAFPSEIAGAELPTAILPVEGFPKLAEFWGTMVTNHRWAIYPVVTQRVVLRTNIYGLMMPTGITDYRHIGKPETTKA